MVIVLLFYTFLSYPQANLAGDFNISTNFYETTNTQLFKIPATLSWGFRLYIFVWDRQTTETKQRLTIIASSTNHIHILNITLPLEFHFDLPLELHILCINMHVFSNCSSQHCLLADMAFNTVPITGSCFEYPAATTACKIATNGLISSSSSSSTFALDMGIWLKPTILASINIISIAQTERRTETWLDRSQLTRRNSMNISLCMPVEILKIPLEIKIVWYFCFLEISKRLLIVFLSFSSRKKWPLMNKTLIAAVFKVFPDSLKHVKIRTECCWKISLT